MMDVSNENITESCTEAVIPLDDIRQDLKLRIIPKAEGTLHRLKEPNGLTGEPFWQLFEGCVYDFHLSQTEFTLSDEIGFRIVQPHTINRNSGRISPNIYTGTLEIKVLRYSGKDAPESEVGKIFIEVQSLKSDYRTDYRTMLEMITDKCTELIMQSSAPTMHYFEPVYGSELEKQRSLYQRFAFVQSVINSDDFAEAVHRVITRPDTRWTETDEDLDIRRVRRFSRTSIQKLARTGNRTAVPDTHYLRQKAGVASVPLRITSSRKTDSHDTPENRFVKHALESFLQFCTSVNEQALDGSALRNEAKRVMEKLESYLQHSLFQEISRAETLPLNSPVLQRKEGYREVLRAWLMYDLAARLVWSGGDDVYAGRKKDVATLYEYWLFFRLLEVMQSVFEISPKGISDLIEVSQRGLDIKLRQGRHIPLFGIYRNQIRNLNIRFSYNRSFRGYTDFMKSGRVSGSGSYTASMRPDYTLSMWPESVTESEAEVNELIIHIHFDAKYKVDNLLGLLPADTMNVFEGAEIERFETEELSWDQICNTLEESGFAEKRENETLYLKKLYWLEDYSTPGSLTEPEHQSILDELESQLLSEEKQEQREGTYRSADLLKMHAYKDAIRRTGGAYVLYPGDKSLGRRGFHEIIPGLGAFAVSPSRSSEGTKELEQFIRQVRDLFVNRISQREQMALQTRRIHANGLRESVSLNVAVPEFIDETDLLNAEEIRVLVGYYRSKEQLKWIVERKKYNFRSGNRSGSLKMDP